MISLFGIFLWKIKVQKALVNKNFLTLLLFFLLSQSLSLLYAVNPDGSLVRLKEYLIVGLFGLYLSSVKFSEIKQIFNFGLIISILMTCLLAIAQFLLGHSIGFWILGERDFSVTGALIAKFDFYEHVFLRPYGTFPHPNLLAGFLIITLPLALIGISRKLKAVPSFLALLVTGTVFITFSRPALILIALQAFLVLKRFWKILLILIVLTSPLVFVRLSSVFTYDSLAILRRQELSEYALKSFFSSPFTGIGLNNFINALARDEVLVGTSRFLQPAHNFVLLILAETGVIGLVGWAYLFAASFWKNFKSNDYLSKILISCLFSIFFLGMFDHYFLTLPQGQRLLFLILGLSFKQLDKIKKY